MMNGKVRSEVLREVIDIVSTLVDEAKFNITKEGLSLKVVDTAHVAMLELSISKDAFDEFKFEPIQVGIDIDKVKEVLKLARPGESIDIKLDENKNRLMLGVGNVTRWMSLVDTGGMSDPKVPNLNLPAKVSVKIDELRQGIRASESVSDHITLKANPEGFEIVSEGETDSVNLKLSKDLLERIECKEPVKSMFPLDYFSNMVKSISSSQSVTLLLGNDYPVKMEFEISAGKGKGMYLLAPRVETE
jgi:proliferating cell nuclear antigen